jgi:hypothetical protein
VLFLVLVSVVQLQLVAGFLSSVAAVVSLRVALDLSCCYELVLQVQAAAAAAAAGAAICVVNAPVVYSMHASTVWVSDPHNHISSKCCCIVAQTH